MKLAGKVALITGAGSGIGQAIALLFAGEGADIAVNDIDLSAAETTVGAVKKLGRRAIAVRADVAIASEVDAMTERVIHELGGIHILVNNAGISAGTLVLEETDEIWDRMIGIVLRGTYLCSKRAGRWMVDHKEGSIVNISSTAGLKGAPGMGAYNSAKAGVINMTRVLALEWAPYNIRVNSIAPGLIDTPMTRSTVAKRMTPEIIKARVPLGRMGEAAEIARVALFLVSDDSSYITGVTIPVDGGTFARGGG